MNANVILEVAVAFVVTVLLTPLLIWLCHRWQVLDFPGRLKIHARPIPRLGGVAVALAIALAAFLRHPLAAKLEWPFFASLALIWASGLVDDIRGLSPILRLAAQVVGAIFLWTAGWRVPMPLGDIPNLLLTCLFLIAIVNSLNFLDGADGIAAGVAGIIAIAYAMFPGAAGNPFASGVAFSLAGACAGFLSYNLSPAKIFLGDSGSNALGLVIAFLALDFWRSQPAAVTVPALLFPLLLCAMPLLDAAFAILRRAGRRSSPLKGDRSHFYDLLLARGLSPVQVALFCYMVAIVLAGISWKERGMSPAEASAVSVLSFAALAVIEVRLGSLRLAENARPQALSAHGASNKRVPAP
jgi:UDP-GlcNAc:undecaprenyl-phosphate GlcNAc-1-phosphate transferase